MALLKECDLLVAPSYKHGTPSGVSGYLSWRVNAKSLSAWEWVRVMRVD